MMRECDTQSVSILKCKIEVYSVKLKFTFRYIQIHSNPFGSVGHPK